jgi:exonuclease VII large subunit
MITPNTAARLLSKAERDATRDFYQKTSDTVTGGTLPGPHHRGWNNADLFEWACQLCDTADHWEQEAARLDEQDKLLDAQLKAVVEDMTQEVLRLLPFEAEVTRLQQKVTQQEERFQTIARSWREQKTHAAKLASEVTRLRELLGEIVSPYWDIGSSTPGDRFVNWHNKARRVLASLTPATSSPSTEVHSEPAP